MILSRPASHLRTNLRQGDSDQQQDCEREGKPHRSVDMAVVAVLWTMRKWRLSGMSGVRSGSLGANSGALIG